MIASPEPDDRLCAVPGCRHRHPELHRQHHPRPDPPTLQSAQLVGGAGASAASTASAKPKAHSYRIKIKPQDKIVGVCAVQASAKKSGGTVVTVKSCLGKGILSLAKTLTTKSTTRPKYVPVRNSAGDWSRWLKLRG